MPTVNLAMHAAIGRRTWLVTASILKRTRNERGMRPAGMDVQLSRQENIRILESSTPMKTRPNKAVRELRKMLKLTQAELAAHVLEQGARLPLDVHFPQAVAG